MTVPLVPQQRERRGNARRRDWALSRLDRSTGYELTFCRRHYRWEVEALPAGAEPSGCVGDATARERDDVPAGTAPPAGPSD